MSDIVVLDGELSLTVPFDGDAELTVPVDGESGIVTRYNWRGYSAYEIAVQHGFVGTEEEWLESLKGADGAQGEKGDKGEDGEQGQDGHTPVKGVDYWTDADKADIVSDVLDALPAAEGVRF